MPMECYISGVTRPYPKYRPAPMFACGMVLKNGEDTYKLGSSFNSSRKVSAHEAAYVAAELALELIFNNDKTPDRLIVHGPYQVVLQMRKERRVVSGAYRPAYYRVCQLVEKLDVPIEWRVIGQEENPATDAAVVALGEKPHDYTPSPIGLVQ